jgi:hypothetical protein
MDDHRQGDTLEQGFGLPPSDMPLGGGAELATMALDLDLGRRWAMTWLGALATITAALAPASHLLPYL